MKKEEIQKVIDDFENLKKKEIYPDCAICTIRWKDNNEEHSDYIIAFHDTIGTQCDDMVFFSCSGFYDGFIKLLGDNNGEDFEIVSVDTLGYL